MPAKAGIQYAVSLRFVAGACISLLSATEKQAWLCQIGAATREIFALLSGA